MKVLGSRLRPSGLGLQVQGFRVQSSGFAVQGKGYRDQCFGCGLQGLRVVHLERSTCHARSGRGDWSTRIPDSQGRWVAPQSRGTVPNLRTSAWQKCGAVSRSARIYGSRSLYHSILSSRVIKKKKTTSESAPAARRTATECSSSSATAFARRERQTTRERTQGQIDGFLSQVPCKCHQNRVASVGD